MNELVAVLCIAFLAGGWIIFMIGRKKRKESKWHVRNAGILKIKSNTRQQENFTTLL